MRNQKLPPPSFNEERLIWNTGLQYVAGIDEVGRGAFAGPVVAAAVIFPPCFCHESTPCMRCKLKEIHEIHDSKLLSPKAREDLSIFIQKTALACSIAEVSVQVINKVGIGKASQIAFRKVVQLLSMKPDFLLVDAFYINRIRKDKQKPIIKGDQKSISIAAASIIAKVYRDTLMQSLPAEYTMYNFSQHKGYGTKQHQEAIRRFGLSTLHRTYFKLQRFTV